MPRNRILVAAFLVFALGAQAPAPESAPAPSPAAQGAVPKTLMAYARDARAARLANNPQGWRDAVTKALEFAPDHPDLLVSAARAEAALGNADAALARLGDAIRRGAGFDVTQMTEFASLARWQAYHTLTNRARANAAPVARATPFAQLRKDSRPEGIAYDPVSHRLFVGSVQGEVFAIDEKGVATIFVGAGSGLREVYGMKVDAQRRLLWVATTVFPAATNGVVKSDIGLSGIVAFSLDDARPAVVRWLDERPTAQHAFNDVALAANGDVYVTDTTANAVYVLRNGAPTIELFAQDPQFSLPNGIVMMPDQRFLIVATVEGLIRIDVASRAVFRLRVPVSASVNSIDGLALDGKDLLGVQNSPYLARVIRVGLDAKTEAVSGVTVLNSHTPGEYSFTTVAVGGDEVYAVGGDPATDVTGKSLAAEPKPQIVRFPPVPPKRSVFDIDIDLPFD